MTINEALNAADALRNNAVGREIKITFLSELDGRICYDIMQPCGYKGNFIGYDSKTPGDTELLVPYPYDALYVSYLEQEIARASNELPRYNNARVLFNEKLSAFRQWYVRTHKTETPNIKFPIRGI